MTTYAVIATYTEAAQGAVEFPEGKTWDDVDNWYVKWDYLNVRFKGDTTYHEFELNSTGASDWKRPDTVEIMHCDEDGEADWDQETLANFEA